MQITPPPAENGRGRGFTLIELSIVLVIIGLIVGGILVGRDLIKAAEVRAQVTQIEKYNQAVNTFRSKYGYLPGDIPDPDASRFGFAPRGGVGQGDGDGFIAGQEASGTQIGQNVITGEPLMFWVDLSQAGLIDAGFNTATPTGNYYGYTNATGSIIDLFYPKAKLGNNLYVYTTGAYTKGMGLTPNPNYVANFFCVSKINSIFSQGFNDGMSGSPTMTVAQAYNIDRKIDDGLPISGNVTAAFISGMFGVGYMMFANNDNVPITSNANGTPNQQTIPPTSITCYDNNNNNANTVTYSMSQNNGAGANCALAFKFQ